MDTSDNTVIEDESRLKSTDSLTINEFKIPAAPKRRSKVKVLDEDAYLDKIGEIIQRDFFPDLGKLKAQNDYLDALENNDMNRLKEICSKYSIRKKTHNEPIETPCLYDTPILDKIKYAESVISDDNPDKKDAQEKIQNLDQFMRTHTSEDNQSFEEILEESEKREQLKHPWLFKEDTQLALKGPSSNKSIMYDRPTNLDTWSYKNKNYIMYVPDGVDYTPKEKQEMSHDKQIVAHDNTRLPFCPFNEKQNKETLQELAQSQARSLEGKIGVDGKELIVCNTPRVNGFSFEKTPSPAPGIDDTPIMTWGQIEGTPFRLDGSDTPIRSSLPGPMFKIAQTPKRELLAHELADKVGQKYREERKKTLEASSRQFKSRISSPNCTLDRFNMMSPAAQKFANAHWKNRLTADKSLRSSYSPKYISSPRTPQTPNIKCKGSATPKTPIRRTPKSPYLSSINNKVGIADNMIKMKNRPSASDFF